MKPTGTSLDPVHVLQLHWEATVVALRHPRAIASETAKLNAARSCHPLATTTMPRRRQPNLSNHLLGAMASRLHLLNQYTSGTSEASPSHSLLRFQGLGHTLQRMLQIL